MKELKTSVPISILDFNLLSWELDNLHLKCYIESYYADVIFKQNKFIIPTKFLVKKKFFFLASSITKNVFLYLHLAVDILKN